MPILIFSPVANFRYQSQGIRCISHGSQKAKEPRTYFFCTIVRWKDRPLTHSEVVFIQYDFLLEIEKCVGRVKHVKWDENNRFVTPKNFETLWEEKRDLTQILICVCSQLQIFNRSKHNIKKME